VTSLVFHGRCPTGCPYRSVSQSDKMTFLLGKSIFQGVFPLDLIELQREFIGRVELASGKPVIMQCDPKFAGHATIRIARDDQPAHLLLHKQEHEAVLPYLVAFQCLLIEPRRMEHGQFLHCCGAEVLETGRLAHFLIPWFSIRIVLTKTFCIKAKVP
jgi:hypothetical protein